MVDVIWHYKRRQQNARAMYVRQPLPAECVDISISPEEYALLAHTDATTLRQNIIDGKVSCQQAVAHCAQRTFKHGRKLCIVAQEHYLRAMKLARERDAQLAKA